MAGCMNKMIGFLLVAIALMHCTAAQTTHVVGDTAGWTVPSPPVSYPTWASSQTFRVGDSLVFNFTTGAHDVATVSEANYNACNTNSTIGPALTTGPVTIRLTTPGPHYYLCRVQGHCSFGQRLSINVQGVVASPPTTASSPSPSPRSTATPPTTSTVPPPSIATPPTSFATPPTTSTVPPPSIATPPTSFATPPTTSTVPPPSIATPPSSSATPPTTSTVPPSMDGSPPSSPASKLLVTGLSVTFLSFVGALFL